MPKRKEFNEAEVKIFIPTAKGYNERVTNENLLEFCRKYDIIVPDGCEFMRFKNNFIRCWIYGGYTIKFRIFEIYGKCNL